ncbi:5-methyltetrahydropteroyltriglutamate--homocysteine methyltransferase [Flexivirga endophytica]|uniref:5-methyltetrahydropteroyltriglutamate--homocysteine methyltransferase n=1 Tax=Flexivirga endophytica TaxID=1849103 RepID=A0A916TB03_9MICO|nr:5-methyltetrahydropteroyltriglutamate--homocysteine S-methyltransferase [Flexivirga endophytica]GGB38579.1 5-methyltetrahydropteroyltriglutamate--homocysteine methyltransferase [Flexivirga endophytica]GHB46578.1 5-methyltetrahydropteroyltriglutamate--homocysteine methyltransferase [Flexivirga endophytica]
MTERMTEHISGHTDATVLGWPRQGPRRELKRAIESYWAGRTSESELHDVATGLRADAWKLLSDNGIDEVPTGDFSYYDHVLDTAWTVGAIPQRYRAAADTDLDVYFAMARGNDRVAPLEMTKWFDTNYHYLVPELSPTTTFAADPARQLEHFAQATEAGHTARPVLVGPLTFLLLSKPAPNAPADFDPLTLLEPLLDVYVEILGALHDAGAAWVQIDEPALVLDQPASVLDAARHALDRLGTATNRPKLLIASYFAALQDAFEVLADAPVDGLAIDCTVPDNVTAILEHGLSGKRLVAGVIDGRNVWVADVDDRLATLRRLDARVDDLVVGTSCSLLHVPLDASRETAVDEEVRSWLAFAREKVLEVRTLATALDDESAAAAALESSRRAVASRRASTRTHDDAVRSRVAAVSDADAHRTTPFDQRRAQQQEALGLPLLPTTTIGSFPQTDAVRKARASLRRGEIDGATYETAMQDEISAVISLQEELGLDVLVHGEPERNDMVQYFAEQLDGYLATTHGWVQSYGTRCVRPPIVFGDVSRPQPMTVRWWQYAQSLTERPVKGMLTGPVTMLAWSFVRDDQPVGDTARQVALALRNEVTDLEDAGCRVIQVDEPALRETLPLRKSERAAYLDWATESFRLATSSVASTTQVHTHMCYADFGDIFAAIDDLDADVISLEATRSGMSLADELEQSGYAKGVGPGVYDIHSPRVPSADEVRALLEKAVGALPARQVWVNPDCGLKTRRPDEVRSALANLVTAATAARASL